jgi:hypothetical protein
MVKINLFFTLKNKILKKFFSWIKRLLKERLANLAKTLTLQAFLHLLPNVICSNSVQIRCL